MTLHRFDITQSEIGEGKLGLDGQWPYEMRRMPPHIGARRKPKSRERTRPLDSSDIAARVRATIAAPAENSASETLW